MKIKYYNEVDSTNLEAKRLIKNGKISENTVLVAKTQTAGIGRLNRRWHSEKNGLWFTIVFPNQNFNSSVTIFTGIILHKILLHFFPIAPLKIKWTNDIFWEDKKLAGILTTTFGNPSATATVTIIGIGVNLNQKSMPEEIENIATSVYIETHKKIGIRKVVKSFLQLFEYELPKYIDQGILPFRDYFQKYNYLSGKKISIRIGKENWVGKAAGISELGELILEIKGTEKRFISADKIDIIQLN
jgi:BirA family biotin operon repressor/biotin-[acetyl-CoA-carboxylase] ligase